MSHLLLCRRRQRDVLVLLHHSMMMRALTFQSSPSTAYTNQQQRTFASSSSSCSSSSSTRPAHTSNRSVSALLAHARRRHGILFTSCASATLHTSPRSTATTLSRRFRVWRTQSLLRPGPAHRVPAHQLHHRSNSSRLTSRRLGTAVPTSTVKRTSNFKDCDSAVFQAQARATHARTTK